MKQISMNKEYQTRDGRAVRIYAVDGVGSYPVHAAMDCDGGWVQREWVLNGRRHSDGTESPTDLIEVKPRIKNTVWLNVYDDGSVDGLTTRGGSDSIVAYDKRIACIEVPIDCEHGEGLEDE